ncbi:MAG: hypothetical protein RIR25_489, partial [Verrucomicrobiota bacterium]
MSMKLSVKNILGLREAEMPIAGITIVAARNGAGKSSLLQALAAAALAEPKMRGVNRKSEFSRIVRDGEAAGSVTLDWGDGWQRVIYPDGTFDSGGRSMPAPVTALGIGHTRLSALKPAERAQAVGALFGGEATVKDLAAFLLKASDGEISEAQAQAQAAATWEKRIVVNGWEACHNAAAEHATKLKGAWQQASGGQMFGAVKSRGWRPDILRPDREYTVEEAEAAVAVAREDLEKRIGDAAVSDTYLLKLQAEASRVPELKEQVEPLRQSVT